MRDQVRERIVLKCEVGNKTIIGNEVVRELEGDGVGPLRVGFTWSTGWERWPCVSSTTPSTNRDP